jgi:hypothetical protein
VHMKEHEIAALSMRFRSRARKLRGDVEALAGALDIVRLSAAISTWEWAAEDLEALAGIPLPDVNRRPEYLDTKAASNVVHLKTPTSSGVPTIDVSRLHRARVEPSPNYDYPERLVFVEAMDDDNARFRTAVTVAALEFIKLEEAEERVSCCQSARDLFKVGASEDRMLRLFEVTRNGGSVTAFVREPYFLVERPAALILKWASIPWDDLDVQPIPGGRAGIRE